MLERIKAAAAGAGFEEMAAFARSQAEQHLSRLQHDPRKVGRGIADQIALASHVSPSEGSRRLGIARVLHTEMPATATLLRDGRISEYTAGLIVSETRHLSRELRGEADARLAAEISELSPRPLIGGDPRRRRFDGRLARLIGIRDGGTCRDPCCDAQIRHTDHITQHRHGGPTSYSNGRGTCARGNQVREVPGWHVEVVHDGLGAEPHTVRTTTPTGHTYTSRAGPAP